MSSVAVAPARARRSHGGGLGLSGVLVLAAGKSTRIARLNGGAPKPLLELGGRSVLEWNLRWLATHGCRRVWINLHHRGEEIRAAVGDGARIGVSVRYSDEPELLGTAGAWRRVARRWAGTSLVVYGDNVLRFDLGRFLSVHRESGALASVALFDPSRQLNTGLAGGVAVLDASGRMRSFEEGTGAWGLVNAGAYLLEPEVLDHVPSGFADFGHDVLPELVRRRAVHGCLLRNGEYCLGLDTPKAYARAVELVERKVLEL